MASNKLAVPSIDVSARPFTTSRSLEPTNPKNPLEFPIHYNKSHHFGSFPGKKVIKTGGNTETGNQKIPIPKMIKPTTQQRPRSILESRIPGIVAYAEPNSKANRKVKQMVPCYSSIVHFYDSQGTYWK